VILDHVTHVLLVNGLPMQTCELMSHALMLCVERLGNVDSKASRNGHQLLICRGVILNHAGKVFDLGVL
jgi:uncharacterized protein YggL (DUF469 family)